MTDIDSESNRVEPSGFVSPGRIRTAKWLFFLFITVVWSGYLFLKCLGMGDHWFTGTAIENAIDALVGTPVGIFWVLLVLHIHLLRREGVYRRREIWLISQSFLLFQGLLFGVTAIPQTPEGFRAILFVLLAAPLAVVLLAPYFSRYKLAFQLAFLMQIVLLVAYALAAIHSFLNKSETVGIAIYLTILVPLSIAALAINSFGLKSRPDWPRQNGG